MEFLYNFDELFNQEFEKDPVKPEPDVIEENFPKIEKPFLTDLFRNRERFKTLFGR